MTYGSSSCLTETATTARGAKWTRPVDGEVIGAGHRLKGVDSTVERKPSGE